jgi:hypothetical protein
MWLKERKKKISNELARERRNKMMMMIAREQVKKNVFLHFISLSVIGSEKKKEEK